MDTTVQTCLFWRLPGSLTWPRRAATALQETTSLGPAGPNSVDVADQAWPASADPSRRLANCFLSEPGPQPHSRPRHRRRSDPVMWTVTTRHMAHRSGTRAFPAAVGEVAGR